MNTPHDAQSPSSRRPSPGLWSALPPGRMGFLIAIAVFVVDQLTKWWVLGPLNFSPPGCREASLAMVVEPRGSAAFMDALRERAALCGHIEVSQVFDLTMVWNYGVSFGLLQAGTTLGVVALSVFALALAGFMAAWLWRADRRVTILGLGFIIGGAVGNVIDRVMFGAVVDFLDFSGPWFSIGGLNIGFPYVFNVADAAINVGVAALVLDWLLEERERRAPPSTAHSG